jgi:hypothetical protein
MVLVLPIDAALRRLRDPDSAKPFETVEGGQIIVPAVARLQEQVADFVDVVRSTPGGYAAARAALVGIVAGMPRQIDGDAALAALLAYLDGGPTAPDVEYPAKPAEPSSGDEATA